MATKANVPVILLSGYLNVRDEIEPLGFSFLQKPLRLSEMLALAARLLPHDPPPA